MYRMKTICICGGGSLGHVIAGWLSSRGKAEVRLLTSRPEAFDGTLSVDTPEVSCHGPEILEGKLSRWSADPSEVIPGADIVLLCLPGYMIGKTLEKIGPWLNPLAFVGSVFSSTGFFIEAQKTLPPSQPLWGFQRVPFIARVGDYGHSAHLLGFKKSLSIAVENCSGEGKEEFRTMVQEWFETPAELLSNWYEASLTNSNPLLHTSRLYTMFGGENDGRKYDHNVLFYEEWTVEAADLLIRMDEEFFRLLEVLPVRKGYLPRILDYYESTDAVSLAAKLSSIAGFKGITSPMKPVGTRTDGPVLWEPDFGSRYFTEDFPYGLQLIRGMAHDHGIPVPEIDRVCDWGMAHVSEEKR